jgi:predicted ATPase
LRLLNNRWERASEGEGQVVLVIGEAGIGKSRLLQRFHELVRDRSQSWLEVAPAPFFQNTPFHAIAELLRQLVGRVSLPVTDARAARATAQGDSAEKRDAAPSPNALPSFTLTSPLPQQSGRETGRRGANPEERLAQLESALVLAGLKPAEAIPLVAPLLNLPLSAKSPPPPIPPEQQRRRLLAILVELVLGAARAQPLTIAIEDLHWADASTLEVIQLLVEQGPTAHLLLLCTARPRVSSAMAAASPSCAN